jgi:DNA helicase-2/ATP-dependent DNA helicase PcrA
MKQPMERLRHLNAAQLEAATTLSGPLLVLAGAGTGKTRVITYRMVELIRQGTPAERILSVTFTNKAAREMRERTSRLLGRRSSKKPFVSTFHALCVRILRQEIKALGYPQNFSIYDRADQESSARTALRDVRIEQASLRPGDLLARISRWKMGAVPPEEATEHVVDDLDYLAAVAYRRYQANLLASGAVDFDDLLLLTKQLFDRFPKVLARHQRRFDHVQIDEYQDTNGTQFALVEALVRPHRSLCVVGDDDQSIYGWRGAEVTHILNFNTHFPGAKVVRLEDNYRSAGNILDAANRLVRHNRGRHEKSLIPCKGPGREIRFLEFDDEQAEAEAIVYEIAELVQHQQLQIEDVAILFRTNEQPRPFESEFRRVGLPYLLIGGQSFFDRREIRDLLGYLKAIAFEQDEASLLRIINRPARGIGTTTIKKLLARAVRAGVTLWDAGEQAAAEGEISAGAEKSLATFRGLLSRYRATFSKHPKQLDQHLQALIEEINYRNEIDKQYKEAQQQLTRAAGLDQLVDAVREYAERTLQPTLEGFLEETALSGRDEEADKEEELSGQAVKLMTLHSAKGLEFPYVYLVGLEEGLLPHSRSIEAGETAIAEERRLAYVGVTRAMDGLVVSRAAGRRKWGKMRVSLPSRFLFEMQQDTPIVDQESAFTADSAAGIAE